MKVDIKLSSQKLDFTKPEQRIISLTASDERTILKATIAVPLADDPTSEKLAINAEAVLGDFFPRLIEELRKKSMTGAR